MTARKAAHSLQRAKGALASGFATVDLHHATGHDHATRQPARYPLCMPSLWLSKNPIERLPYYPLISRMGHPTSVSDPNAACLQ
jgi:hypothetical protein